MMLATSEILFSESESHAAFLEFLYAGAYGGLKLTMEKDGRLHFRDCPPLTRTSCSPLCGPSGNSVVSARENR
jgi:hypothetical protein